MPMISLAPPESSWDLTDDLQTLRSSTLSNESKNQSRNPSRSSPLSPTSSSYITRLSRPMDSSPSFGDGSRDW